MMTNKEILYNLINDLANNFKLIIPIEYDINYQDKYGYTLLHKACAYQTNIDNIKIILNRKPNLLIKNSIGCICLGCLRRNRESLPIFKELIKNITPLTESMFSMNYNTLDSITLADKLKELGESRFRIWLEMFEFREEKNEKL